MSRDWSRREVEAAVADYFAMLRAEIGGIPYNKAAHNRELRERLDNRSKAAVERKHQNITAILHELDHPGIDGYKPLGNYQALLAEAVAAALETDDQLAVLAAKHARDPANSPAVESIVNIEEQPPEPDIPRSRGVAERPPAGHIPRPRRPVDYVAIEARNRSLGAAGEQLVLEFEAERLHAAGAKRLASRVEQVSVTQGDGLGYDVLSFEVNGRERFIEVKTTSFSKRTPFYVTRREVQRSQATPECYQLYRLFNFREAPGLFRLPGQLDRTCHLDPAVFRGTVA